ncbi:MAG: DUF3034 family protein [Gammaproteobacteria bacterium]|nr:DUF3034 family protein [Gammaproteobacteria bacterium]
MMNHKGLQRFLGAIRGVLLPGGVAIGCAAALLGMPLSAQAATKDAGLFGQSRPAGTGGITSISGAAGGGLVPWALIAGYGGPGQIGFTASYTHASTANFNANGYGVAAGIDNRVEVSLTQQNFDLGNTGPYLAASSLAPPLPVPLGHCAPRGRCSPIIPPSTRTSSASRCGYSEMPSSRGRGCRRWRWVPSIITTRTGPS